MSMCGLFLLEAAKKADYEFQTPHTSSHHSVRDAEKDVTCHLIEGKVVCDRKREGCEFKDPLTLGAKKVASGYIEEHIHKNELEDAYTENSTSECNESYELQ